MNKLYRLNAVVEKEGNWFVSHCIELSVSSQGKTIDAALNNLKEACQLYLKHADREELKALKSKNFSEPVVATITV